MPFTLNAECHTRWSKIDLNDALWNTADSLYEKLESSGEFSLPRPSKACKTLPSDCDFSYTLPTEEQLRFLLKETLNQQRKVARKENKFSFLMKKRILVIQRILYAIKNSKSHKKKPKKIEKADKKQQKEKPSPLLNLSVQTGIRFMFILLQECWELDDGIDADICREFLENLSSVLGSLPPLALYDAAMSPLTENTLNNIEGLLKNLACPGSKASPADRISCLAILSSFVAHRGSLSGVLSFISFLLSSQSSQPLPMGCVVPLLDQMKKYESNTKPKRPMKDKSLIYSSIALKENNSAIGSPKEIALVILKQLYGLADLLGSQNYQDPLIERTSEVFIWGCRGNGKLGSGSDATKIKTPELSSLFSELQPQQIELGSSMTTIVDEEGRVYSLGKGDYGRLGINSNNDTSTPTLLNFNDIPISRVFLSKNSYGHGLAIDESRTVWSWGDGDYGKLGHDSTEQQGTPKRIRALASYKIASAACGPKHTAVVTDEGKLFTFGINEKGCLGIGPLDSDSYSIPQRVSSLNRYVITAVGCGDLHCIATSRDSQLTFSWGDGTSGRIGLGKSVDSVDTPQIIPQLSGKSIIQVLGGDGYSSALTDTGSVYVMGEIFGGPNAHIAALWVPYVQTGELEGVNVDYIAGGRDYMLALADDGEVYSWGKNSTKQCGVSGAEITSPKCIAELSGRGIRQLSAGSGHSCAWTISPNNQDLESVKEAPFCVELTSSVFKQLHQFMKEHYPHSDVFKEKEQHVFFLVSCLQVLRTNLYHVTTTQKDPKEIGLGESDELLDYLRTTLLEMVQFSSHAIQMEARLTFQSGWKILLPTVTERYNLLKTLLPKYESSRFTEAQRFLVGLLVNTLTRDNELASFLHILPQGQKEPVKNDVDVFEWTNQILKICEADFCAQCESQTVSDVSVGTANDIIPLLCYIQKFLLANEMDGKEEESGNELLAGYLSALFTCIDSLLQVFIKRKELLLVKGIDIFEDVSSRRMLNGSLLHSVFSHFVHASFSISECLKPYYQSLFHILQQLSSLCSSDLASVQATETIGLQYISIAVTGDNPTSIPENYVWLVDITRTLGLFLGTSCAEKIKGDPLSDVELKMSSWLSSNIIKGGLVTEGYKIAHETFVQEFIGGGKECDIFWKKITDIARNKLWLIGTDDENDILLKTLRHILACLLKHQGIIGVAKLFASDSSPASNSLLLAFEGLFKAREEILLQIEKASCSEICDPIMERCCFLLFEVAASNSIEEEPRDMYEDEFLVPSLPDSAGLKMAGELILPQTLASPTMLESPQKMKREEMGGLKRSSSFSSGERRVENENLAEVVSTMRKFSWLGKSKGSNLLSHLPTVHSLRDAILRFLLEPLSHSDLVKAIKGQQKRAESRISGLSCLLQLIKLPLLVSVRRHVLIGAHQLWLDHPEPWFYLDHIPASLRSTQRTLERNIHLFYSYLISQLNVAVRAIITANEAGENADAYKWMLHSLFQVLASPFVSSDVAALVQEGLLPTLTLMLDPIHTNLFGVLQNAALCLLKIVVSTLGLDNDHGSHSLSKVDRFLRELIDLIQQGEKIKQEEEEKEKKEEKEDGKESKKEERQKSIQSVELLCILRRVCVTSRAVGLFSSGAWTTLLLSIIKEGYLQDRIMALRFLEIILVHWNLDRNQSQISLMLQELLRILASNIAFPQVSERKMPISANLALFDKSYCDNAKVSHGGLSFTQTESARISEPGYVYGTIPMVSGVHRWEFQVQHDAADDETLCIGVGRKPLSVRAFEKSPDLWLLRGYNGKLYHKTALDIEFDGFTLRDRIAIEVDVDAGTLTYYKNDKLLGVAFDSIEGPVYPVVLFYGGSTRAKVTIVESGCIIPSDKLATNANTPSIGAPPYTTFCEEIIYLIRRLHKGQWGRFINQFITKSCRAFSSLYLSLACTNDPSTSMFSIPPLVKSVPLGELLSAISLLSGVETGFRTAGRVEHEIDGIGITVGFIVPEDRKSSALVHYNSGGVRVKLEFVSSLTVIPSDPFDVSKLILSRSEIKSLFSVLERIVPALSVQQMQIQLFSLKALGVLLSERENLLSSLRISIGDGITIPSFLLGVAVQEAPFLPPLSLTQLERLLSVLYSTLVLRFVSNGDPQGLHHPKVAFVIPENQQKEETNQVEGKNQDKNQEEENENEGEEENQVEGIMALWFRSSDIDPGAVFPLPIPSVLEIQELMVTEAETPKLRWMFTQISQTLQIQYARRILAEIYSQHPSNASGKALVSIPRTEADEREIGKFVCILAQGKGGLYCSTLLDKVVSYVLQCNRELSFILTNRCIASLKDISKENSSVSVALGKALLPSLISSHTLDKENIKRIIDALALCVLLQGEQKHCSWSASHIMFLCSSLFQSKPQIKISWESYPNVIKLIEMLPLMIQQQIETEKKKGNLSENIFFSPYLKSLATLFYLFPHEKTPCKQLNTFCRAKKLVSALASRSPFDPSFLAPTKLLASASGEEGDMFSDNSCWSLEMDEQLLMWQSENPADWKRPVDVYVLGSNSHGQLSMDLDLENIEECRIAPYFSNLNPLFLSAGATCSFVLTQDGSLYACGKGDYMRLGLGSSDNVPSLTFLRTLQGVQITHISSSTGSYGHALAIDSTGKVWSWGDGDFGKLGHANKDQQKLPKIIQGLHSYTVVQISCGYSHSACVTDTGELYVWGESKWCGSKSSSDLVVPTRLDLGTPVSMVACGQNHTMVCSQSRKIIWTFGDGEDGKLGLGDDLLHILPQVVTLPDDIMVKKICVGPKRSMILSEKGELYCWGSGSDGCLGLGDLRGRKIPTFVHTMQDRVVVDVACGCNHVVAITETETGTEVFSWGQNEYGQIGHKDCSELISPQGIVELKGKNIWQVSAGNFHTIFWTMKNYYHTPYYPTIIPDRYELLTSLSPSTLYFRLHILKLFSDLVFEALPLFNLKDDEEEEEKKVSLNNRGASFEVYEPKYGLERVRSLLHTTGKISLLRAWVSHTNTDSDVGPTITLNRYLVRSETLFQQAAKQISGSQVHALRASKRAWKVKFSDEGADDVGGPYNESLSEMCAEVQNEEFGLFSLSRNGLDSDGLNQDRFVLPITSIHSLKLYFFFGVFLGVAIRTKNPLPLFLAPIFWKKLLSIPLSISDLSSVDKSFVTTHQYIFDINKYGIKDEDSFALLPLEPFQPLHNDNGEIITLTYANRKEYVELAMEQRLYSAAHQEIIRTIRHGLGKMVPLPLFSLFTPEEVELLVCGAPEIDWNVLKVNTIYKGSFHNSSEQVLWLWEVLEEFESKDRASFLRFVWGHTRLPVDPADIRQQFLVQSGNSSPADQYLPAAQTCFFKLILPCYSSKDVLREKLTYALRFCKTIDTDDYART